MLQEVKNQAVPVPSSTSRLYRESDSLAREQIERAQRETQIYEYVRRLEAEGKPVPVRYRGYQSQIHLPDR